MKVSAKLILNVAHHGCAKMKIFHFRSPKTAFFTFLSYETTYLYLVPVYFYERKILWKNCLISWNNLFVSCTRILLGKKGSMKELRKNHLKIFLIKLCRILHARRKDHFCFYKYFINQTFIFINSKVVYVKKHLAHEVYHLEEIKFLLPLNKCSVLRPDD